MIRNMLRSLALAAGAVAVMTLSGCSTGHARGHFYGFVIGKTEAEIIDKVGQPVAVERANPETPIMVYNEKTFDIDNGNRIDSQTRVYLGKGKDGRVVAIDVGYSG